MENKIKLHNEVLLIGRIMSRQKGYRCNNKKAIRVKLAMPNDNDYNLNPNTAYVYFYEDDKLFKSLKRFQAIAINGHIENNWGQRIIVDVFSLLKENLSH